MTIRTNSSVPMSTKTFREKPSPIYTVETRTSTYPLSYLSEVNLFVVLYIFCF